MGEVWKARDGKLRREVAIKTLPPALASDPDRLARLEREATSLAAVSHPNIAAIYGLEEHAGTRYLVLELVDGETLAERLTRGPIPVKQTLEIALQIAEALDAAHERGVIHRDLKPDNVMLMPDGRVKVLDFGLAKNLTPVGARAPTESVLKTELGMIMGTAPYMSPEQARGEPAGPQTDIWSFGVVLYEMLTGVSPFARATTAETLARVLEAEPDFERLPATTPTSARQLVRRCLEKERRRRVKHAGDVRIGVEDALAEPSTGAAPPLARAGISRRATLTGGAALGLLGAGFGGAELVARRAQPLAVPSYQRLTFRRGMIRTARFGPDFQTILYGALWDGDVCRVYTVRPDSPESAALPLPPATPLAVSISGELALALGTHFRGVMPYGTLARVPLAGGGPRELEENVKYADWSPDGRYLAIVRLVGDHDQLELPAGTILAEPDAPGGGFSFPRISPRGDAVAVFELIAPGNLFGRVVIVDRSGVKRAISPYYFNVFGLAWKGDEVWFTAADELPLFRNTIYAMDASGAVRIVGRVPGNTSLHDIAPDGRALIAQTDDRGGVTVRVPDEAAERDLSWLDAPVLADISADGRRILFSETGVGGGPRLSTYLRGTDGSLAVRLGDGFAQALSPDGRWAIVVPDRELPHFDVIPTGPGQVSRLERPGLKLLRARWLPDGRNVVVLAQPREGWPRLYVLDVAGSTMRPVTPDGLVVGYGGWSVSPDGAMVAVSTGHGPELFPIAGGESLRVPSGSDRWTVVGWIESGLLVSEDPAAGGTVFLIDPATGRRDTWADFQPQDPAGIMNMNLGALVVTPDGRGYGYSWHRAMSDLYLVEGWS
jgi:dipeptidyl aminopeptidase/acylaminoacyl peptidase